MRWYVLCPLLIALIERSRIYLRLDRTRLLRAVRFSIRQSRRGNAADVHPGHCNRRARRHSQPARGMALDGDLTAHCNGTHLASACGRHRSWQPLWAVAAFLVVVNATCGPLARGFSSRPRPQSASVDGDVAISELIRLGLVETVWSDGGAAYRAGRKLRLGACMAPNSLRSAGDRCPRGRAARFARRGWQASEGVTARSSARRGARSRRS